ncbi:hypothetical protein FF36_05334 [Frankia torreyi]|uniref:Helix-turn-helix domain n=1 Tax=Frankia torreyi TaxID=1856 RepID=A0A0D8B8E4_9ACTN|nr:MULTISPECIES: hypothetical protein [Frankia]KJE20360.1 hypothetical protein FF36_05334 [Frankia torreyi]KQM02736.1 hypothetical protein FF86_105728 [Frankia sp. CpI1-P]
MADVDVVEAVPGDLVPRAAIPDRWPVITARMARRLTSERRIPSWTVGRRVFVSAGDVESWLAACRRPAA